MRWCCQLLRERCSLTATMLLRRVYGKTTDQRTTTHMVMSSWYSSVDVEGQDCMLLVRCSDQLV